MSRHRILGNRGFRPILILALPVFLLLLLKLVQVLFVPCFSGFSERSPTSEVKVNLGALASAVKAHHDKNGTYICGQNAKGATVGRADCGWSPTRDATYAYRFQNINGATESGANKDDACRPPTPQADQNMFVATACKVIDASTEDHWYVHHDTNTGLTSLVNSKWSEGGGS